jgi:acyl-CoA synthetase (AMP-forming)/AMP-acid ligase II
MAAGVGRAPTRQRARLRARQGAPNIIARTRVLGDDGLDVPADGQTIGEIAVSRNDVMLRYYRDDEATRKVTRSGCFLTGDLAVMHYDGYVEIRDRSKDIIISRGGTLPRSRSSRCWTAIPRWWKAPWWGCRTSAEERCPSPS